MAGGNALGPDDDLKLSYAYMSLAPSKAATSAVAKFMGLKEGATNWRYQALMKRCKNKFGEIGPDGTPLGGGNDDGNNNNAGPGPATPAPKRKRTEKTPAKSTNKKAKVEDGEKSAAAVAAVEDDNEEEDTEMEDSPTKKASKPINPAAKSPVKSEPEV